MSSSYLPVARFLHAVQLLVGGLSLSQSYVAIRNLQQYEGVAEKAAAFSKTAKGELTRTRTTQASGVFALVFSVASSIGLLFFSEPNAFIVLLNIANIGLTVSAWQHMENFWKPKQKVPLVEGYNTAQTATKGVRNLLGVLAASWILTGVYASYWELR